MQISGQPAQTDPEYARLQEAVIAAAREFRTVMEHYLAAQTHLAAQGFTVATLVERNLDAFETTVQAEEALFAALNALDQFALAAALVSHAQ